MPISLDEALEGLAQAARHSADAQSVAEQEAAEYRAQAAEYERLYKKERRRAEELKAELARCGIPTAAGGVHLPARAAAVWAQRRHTCSSIPLGAVAGGDDQAQCIGNGSECNRSHSQQFESTNFAPTATAQSLRREPSNLSSPGGLSLAALSSTLAACLLFQNATRRVGSNTTSNLEPCIAGQDTEGGEHAMISVADDGRSGVAATAAAAVSVALAQSWAAVAGGKSSVVPHADSSHRNLISFPERARFKLVAAVPRNLKPKHRESSPSPTPSPSARQRRESRNLDMSPSPSSFGNNGNGIKMSASHQSLANEGGGGGMALESLDDAHVLDNRQEATWRATGGHLKLHWLSAPTTILVVHKPTSEVVEATGRAVAWLLTRGLTVYTEPSAYKDTATATLAALRGVCEARNTTTTTTPKASTNQLERSNSTGSAVFGAISPRSSSAFEAELAREAAATAAVNADDLIHRLLLTWPVEDTRCDNVLPTDVADRLDMVVTLGGDGTVLWACSLFGRDAVPPVVPLAMGSLGFMTPFPLHRMHSVLSRVTSVDAGFPLMLRHRLQCRIVRAGDPGGEAEASSNGTANGIGLSFTDQYLSPAPCGEDVLVLNEVVIDRGMTASLANLQCFVDRHFVTSVQGDGLIVSTPTGSTAYNLAAGGSMVHPAVPCILFTPICPHTLSSRPVVFPEHVTLRVKVPSDSRCEAYCSFDGRARQALYPGDSVLIQLSQRPVPVVCNRDSTHDWFMSVREGLHWNRRAVQKPMDTSGSGGGGGGGGREATMAQSPSVAAVLAAT